MDVKDCSLCSELCKNRTQIVNGEGDEEAKILFVGEAPGENEDIEGRPFIGKSGKILREVIDNQVDHSFRITNSVRCRPPNNRDPKNSEIENCKKFLYKEIKQVNPDYIIALGKIPSKSILGKDVSTVKQAGEENSINIDGKSFSVIICPHPAATLYNNDYESIFIETIKNVSSKLE